MKSSFSRLINSRAKFVDKKYNELALFRKAIQGCRVKGATNESLQSIRAICLDNISETKNASPSEFYQTVVEAEREIQSYADAWNIKRLQMFARMSFAQSNYLKTLKEKSNDH